MSRRALRAQIRRLETELDKLCDENNRMAADIARLHNERNTQRTEHTMSERPIEEIIGWTKQRSDAAWYYDRWKRPDGVECDDAEVDDLLAWLEDRGFDVRPPYDHGIGELPIRLEVFATHASDKKHQGLLVEVESRTSLLEALTLAVREVAQ